MPDFYRDSYGRVRAVRASPGYDRALEGMTAKDKKYLRDTYGAYTNTPDRKSRQERINAAADKTSLHSGIGGGLSPQAKQDQMDKMNDRRGRHRH